MPEQTFGQNNETASVVNSGEPINPEIPKYQPAPPSSKSRWWIWLLVLIACVVGGALYYQRQSGGESKAKAAPLPRAVPIAAAPAKKGDIGIYVEALGTVTPVYTVSVTSRVQGQIMDVHYKEGQMINKGDSLLEIDPRPYQAALTQAEGQLAHDQALLSEARIDLDRYKSAFARNAVAQQQVYDQEQAVLQDEGTVKNDEGTVENAKVNLVYTHIVSPIEGRVGLRLVDPGNIVQANGTTPLVVVTQLEPITVIFSVAEDYLPQIQQQLRAGHTMTVTALDRTQEKQIAVGSLLTLDNQIDTTTGTVKLKAIFPNKDSSLFPNQFVNARLLVETEHNATLVPTAAIQRNAQGAFVYVISPDKTAQMKTVKPGTVDGNTAAVDGIEPNQLVAVNGFDRLQDGVKVSFRNGNGQGDANGQENGNGQGSGNQENGKRQGNGGRRGNSAGAGNGEATP
jgi:membrane fusion protein, multidrug efflux system